MHGHSTTGDRDMEQCVHSIQSRGRWCASPALVRTINHDTLRLKREATHALAIIWLSAEEIFYLFVVFAHYHEGHHLYSAILFNLPFILYFL